MRQGKKSPSIWASSQPTNQPSRWNEKANPSKVVCQTLALSSMNLGCWNRKVHVAPDHSTAHAPLKYVWRSSACSYTNVMFRNCFFFSRSSLLSIQLLVVASTHDSAVTQALPTSVSAFHELPANAKWREKTEHNNKLMFNVSPGKFIAFSVRSKIAKMWMDINRAGKMIAMHETKEDNDMRTLE